MQAVNAARVRFLPQRFEALRVRLSLGSRSLEAVSQ